MGLVLDPKWICVQWDTGRRPAIANDFKVLETSVEMYTAAGSLASHAIKSVQTISKCIQACAPESFEAAEALSLSLLSRIWRKSQEYSILGRIRDKIVSSMPTPCLVPVVTHFAPPVEALKVEVNCHVLTTRHGGTSSLPVSTPRYW